MQLLKYIILPLFILIGTTAIVEAQTGFKYQAVIRDADGNAVIETMTDVRMSIHNDAGELIYSEVHNNSAVNEYGILGVHVGTGLKDDDITIDFDDIEWSVDSYSLSVDLSMPDVQGGDWVFYGTSPILKVPIAMYAETVGDKDDADADPQNEIQNLSLVDNVLTISDGNSVTLALPDGMDEQILSLEGPNLSISGGNTINLQPIIGGGNPTDEIQQLEINGDQLTISGEGGNTITIPASGTLQNLSLTDNILSISDGNSVTLDVSSADNQQLSLNGTRIILENGGEIDLGAIIPEGGTDNQELSYDETTNTLTLRDGGSIDLSGLEVNADADTDPTNEFQNLNYDAATNELSLTDGNTVTIAGGMADADADPTNEIQTISFDDVTNELSLTNGGVVIIPSVGDDADADPTNEIQNLNYDAATNELSLTDGNTVTIAGGIADADADPTNEIQTITFDDVTNELSLTNGGVVTIPSVGDDADADPTNEIQNLNYDAATNELSLTNGNTVTIAGGMADADADPSNEFQNLSFDVVTNELSLTDGNTVTIPTGGTDDQAISYDEVTNMLTLEDGGTVDLSELEGGNSGTDDQMISRDGTRIILEDGGEIDLGAIIPTGGTDDQNLENASLAGTELTIEIEGGDPVTVDLATLPGLGGSDDNQNLTNATLVGTVLSIAIEGGDPVSVDLSGLPDNVEDADTNPNNEIQELQRNGDNLELVSQDGTINGSIAIGGGVVDADPDPNNEIQDLLFNDTNFEIGLSNSPITIDLVEVIDAVSPTQELLFDDTDYRLGITGTLNTVDLSSLRSAGGGAQDLLFNDTSYEIGLTDSGITIDLEEVINEVVAPQELIFDDTDFRLGITGTLNTVDLSSLRSAGSGTQDLTFDFLNNELGLTGSTETIDLTGFRSPWEEIYTLSLPPTLVALHAGTTPITGDGGIRVSNNLFDEAIGGEFEGSQIGVLGSIDKIDPSDLSLIGVKGDVVAFLNDPNKSLVGVSGNVATSATGRAIGVEGFANDGNEGFGVIGTAVNSQYAVGGKFHADGRVASCGLIVSASGANGNLKGIRLELDGQDAIGSEYDISASRIIGRAGQYEGGEDASIIGSENSLFGDGNLVGYNSVISGGTNNAAEDILVGYRSQIFGSPMAPASQAFGAQHIVRTLGGSANGVDIDLQGDGVTGITINGISENNYSANGVRLFLNGTNANVSGINSNVGSNLDADIATAGSFVAFDADRASYGIIAKGQTIGSQSILAGDVDQRSRPVTIQSTILGNDSFQAASYNNSSGQTAAIYDYAVLGVNSTDGQSIDGDYTVGVAGFAEGPFSSNYGVWGESVANTGYFNTGVFGKNLGAGTSDYAGYFVGKVRVSGNLEKAGGTFKIDHPQDPANKYLVHSFVESPDMMNIYNGNTTTDDSGRSTVELPDYFESLNIEFRYQLTVIGEFAQAIVSQKVDGNKFEIMTDKPGVEVSWQVTGVRNDPWAKKNRFVDVVDKKEHRGTYLMPELYGQPESRSYMNINKGTSNKKFKATESVSLEESMKKISEQHKK